MRSTVLALSLAFLGPVAAHADGLSEARAGKLQCYEPNLANRTCHGLFKIVIKADGSATSGGDVLLNVLNGSSVLVMRTPQSAATVTGNSTCSVARKSDIEGSVFLLDGKPVNAESDRRIKDDMETRQAASFGTTECSIYTVAKPGVYQVTETVNGKPQPVGSHIVGMIWVNPSEGYKIGP